MGVPNNYLRLFTALAAPTCRHEAIEELASCLGADHLFIFIEDAELGILLPAPGFPQTLPGRQTWRAFLDHCVREEQHRAKISYPDANTTMQVYGLSATDGSVLALLGDDPFTERAAEAVLYLPLLAQALRGEQAGRAALEQAKAARAAAAQVNAIATALEATRVELVSALQAAAVANERLQHELTERRRAEGALKTLNESLEQHVAERTAELEEANAHLRIEIGERVRAENALEESNAALQQSNRELQNFAYVASHDLQEPLRKISSFAGLLMADYGEQLDETARFYVERMQDAAMRMSRLIRDLLAFSRIATQKQRFQPTDLNEIIADVLLDLEVRIKENGGRVEVDHLPCLQADPTQMRQLLQNLIGNALKFHRPEVPPVVRVHSIHEPCQGRRGQATQELRLLVEDNGIGFDEKYLDRIFSPFQRLHGQSAFEGTGMGLAICRHIAERHGGAITARSSPGEGTTFIVTLPCKPPPAPTASVVGLL